MKKNKTIIIITLCLASVLICLGIYFYLKRQYDKKMQAIHDEKYATLYESEFTSYYYENGQYPFSTDELLQYVQSKFEHQLDKQAFMMDNIGKDPFSKKGGYIQYFPLYDRLSKQRVSFIY